MQKIRNNASAFKAKQMFGLPEYSRHSFHRTKDVPIVKINSVPITKEQLTEKKNHIKKDLENWRKVSFFLF